MSKIYKFLLIILFVALTQDVKGMIPLDDVLRDYQKTLPIHPEKETSPEKTARRALRFVFQFMEKEDELQKSLDIIDVSSPFDSMMADMKFHLYYTEAKGEYGFKDAREQQVGSFYRAFLNALHTGSPVIGHMYYHAFKSANIYNKKAQKGKVLSRDVDLQERVNYETYRHLQNGLKHIGIDFQFVVLRDTFHALSFNLSDPFEKIYKDAPEICQYGRDIQKISAQMNITTLDFSALKNKYGKSFDVFIEENLQTIIEDAMEVPNEKASSMKGFLRKEYEYEAFSHAQKDRRAMERAKRYIAIIDFVRSHEKDFIIPTFMDRFGSNYIPLFFSTHVENHLQKCQKIPLRNINNFLGGCNSQHQLPLLQQKQDGTYKFYTIRSDYMNKLLKTKSEDITLIDVSNYKTFLYKGDDDIGKIPAYPVAVQRVEFSRREAS